MNPYKPLSGSEYIIRVLKNLPNLMMFLLLKLAEKLKILSWFYPQLKNQPDLPKMVGILEAEVRKAQIPMRCVVVEIENSFIYFYLKPLIKTTKRNFDTMIKKLINKHKLPTNTFVRKRETNYLVLIDRNWIVDNFPAG